MIDERVQLMIQGRRGRMGSRVEALARSDSRFEVVDDLSSSDVSKHGVRRVIIDFSSDAGAQAAAAAAQATGAALLVGTTGLSDKALRAIDELEKQVAVMVAPNTSLGIAVLAALLKTTLILLNGRVEVDIIEYHHSKKKDAPSGTALRLADVANAAAPGSVGDERIHPIRGGDIVGEHQVHLAMEGERLVLTHMATSRDVFARGAIEGAAWLARQSPGRYLIEHALGLPRR